MVSRLYPSSLILLLAMMAAPAFLNSCSLQRNRLSEACSPYKRLCTYNIGKSGLPECVLLVASTETVCAWASAKQFSHACAVHLASESLLQESALGIHKCPGDPQVLQHMMQLLLKQRRLVAAVSTATNFLNVSSLHDCSTTAMLWRVIDLQSQLVNLQSKASYLAASAVLSPYCICLGQLNPLHGCKGGCYLHPLTLLLFNSNLYQKLLSASL